MIQNIHIVSATNYLDIWTMDFPNQTLWLNNNFLEQASSTHKAKYIFTCIYAQHMNSVLNDHTE